MGTWLFSEHAPELSAAEVKLSVKVEFVYRTLEIFIGKSERELVREFELMRIMDILFVCKISPFLVPSFLFDVTRKTTADFLTHSSLFLVVPPRTIDVTFECIFCALRYHKCDFMLILLIVNPFYCCCCWLFAFARNFSCECESLCFMFESKNGTDMGRRNEKFH